MIYRIRQVTAYRYGSSVPFARHTLRLTPVSTPEQRVISSSIAIDPAPHERAVSEDFFGNHIVQVGLETPHQSLTITSEAEVDVAGPAELDGGATPDWALVRTEADAVGDFGPRSPAHQIYPSRLVPLNAEITSYVASSFPPARPILAAGIEVAKRIKAEFAYDPTATDVTTPTAEAFALRRGVCQDFAQVMIAGLRGLGLPAAYVSGYLRTVPRPGMPRLEGSDATHAWVALWCGAQIGWRGLDPTNGIETGTDHIALAFGRDYADVSPVDGVIMTAGGHTLSVSVDVQPVERTTEEKPG